MVKIEAVIQPFKLDDVKAALDGLGVERITIVVVTEHGRSVSQKAVYRGAEYLDNLTRQWTRDAGCVTYHTTLSYSLCRPAMVNVPRSAMDELREFMEYRVANWSSAEACTWACTPPRSPTTSAMRSARARSAR